MVKDMTDVNLNSNVRKIKASIGLQVNYVFLNVMIAEVVKINKTLLIFIFYKNINYCKLLRKQKLFNTFLIN